MKESIWTRKPASAPARETLTREQIVRTAMTTLDAEGLAGLSIRKLAAKLGAGATSLYWHVPTKDDLIDLLIDEIWGEIDVPDPALAGWRNGALLFGHSLRAAVIRHHWLPEVMYTRPSMGPNAMALGSRGLVLFGAAGFTGKDLDYAMGSVMAYTLGTASAEVATREITRKSGVSLTEWAGEVLKQVDAVADEDMRESVRRRADRDLDTTFSESFTFGLEALLDGLETRVRN
ncbi:TetR family transcriptional regulator [Kribbella qitaiheensis]|uniref:TetR family transcriptional regulator n=1 Tax=Kribbella qitaiheensis TaxID=1544730 RepID=A0A7G6WV83_9ACTN|nr:TetR/AcrR family transcriptional regulator C-terminal domain-containing protein [Kribbella qitaiheensis]QNE17898.1 TetR family transcriptional regulator [Kribbella qitaiheensis]